jgi:hypothetical protein
VRHPSAETTGLNAAEWDYAEKHYPEFAKMLAAAGVTRASEGLA